MGEELRQPTHNYPPAHPPHPVLGCGQRGEVALQRLARLLQHRALLYGSLLGRLHSHRLLLQRSQSLLGRSCLALRRRRCPAQLPRLPLCRRRRHVLDSLALGGAALRG